MKKIITTIFIALILTITTLAVSDVSEPFFDENVYQMLKSRNDYHTSAPFQDSTYKNNDFRYTATNNGFQELNTEKTQNSDYFYDPQNFWWTTNNFISPVGSTPETFNTILAFDADDLQMLRYDTVNDAFVETTYNLDTIIGENVAFADKECYVIDWNNDGYDNFVCVDPDEGSDVYVMEWSPAQNTVVLAESYNLSDCTNCQQTLDLRWVNGELYLAMLDDNGEAEVDIYSISTGTPSYDNSFEYNVPNYKYTDSANGQFITIDDSTTSLIMSAIISDDSINYDWTSFFCFAGENNWTNPQCEGWYSEDSDSTADYSVHEIYMMDVDGGGDLEIVLTSLEGSSQDRNYVLLPLSPSTYAKYLDQGSFGGLGALGTFGNTPFSADAIVVNNSGEEICFLTENGLYLGVTCHDEEGNEVANYNVSEVNSGLRLDLAGTCPISNYLFTTESIVQYGVFSNDFTTVHTPFCTFTVTSTGAKFNAGIDNLGMFAFNIGSPTTVQAFFPIWLNDDDDPDLFGWESLGTDTFVWKTTGSTLGTENPYPSISDIQLVDNTVCVNQTEGIEFQITMDNVPEDGFFIESYCNNTNKDFSFGDTGVITSDSFSIVCNVSDPYLQTTGNKGFTIYAQNANTGETGGGFGKSYYLNEPYICNQALLGLNFTQLGIIPTFTHTSYTPVSPVLSGTPITFRFDVTDQDGGNYTFGFAQNIVNTALFSTDPDEYIDLLFDDIVSADQTISKSQHDFFSESGGLTSMILEKTISIDIVGDYTTWVMAYVKADDVDYTNADFNVPLASRIELLSITEEEIINQNYELPDWFQERPWITAIPLVICDASNCYGTSTNNDTNSSYIGQKGDGTPSGSNTTLSTGLEGDVLNEWDNAWDGYGLKSEGSRFMAGVILLLIVLIPTAVILAQNGMTSGMAPIIIIETIIMIIFLTVAQLFPLWLAVGLAFIIFGALAVFVASKLTGD